MSQYNCSDFCLPIKNIECDINVNNSIFSLEKRSDGIILIKDNEDFGEITKMGGGLIEGIYLSENKYLNGHPFKIYIT